MKNDMAYFFENMDDVCKGKITAEELVELNDIPYTAAREELDYLKPPCTGLTNPWEPKENKKPYVIK